MFTIIHGSGRPAKNGEGLGAFITRMMSGGRRGGGAQLPKQCTGPSVWAFYCSFGLQTLLLVLASKKLAFKFSMYIFEYRPLPPYVQLASTHVMNAPRPSPIFAGFPLPCIIVNANEREKWGGLGTRLDYQHVSFFIGILTESGLLLRHLQFKTNSWPP